jgi:ABC-type multidrug transport system ATPase subunit
VTARLIAQGVGKRFRAKVVLDAVDLAVAGGEAVALVGENGAGKTTLLRICAGLLGPDCGTVEVDGAVAYCPQQPGVLELLNADEHLVLFGRGTGLGRDDALAQGRALLEGLGFPPGERSVVRDLSGGSRQKLNLALALLGDPGVLLLDEPYQGFDHGTYVDFWERVDGWRDEGRAIVIVTHLLAELQRVDRVVELAVHPSRRARARS